MSILSKFLVMIPTHHDQRHAPSYSAVPFTSPMEIVDVYNYTYYKLCLKTVPDTRATSHPFAPSYTSHNLSCTHKKIFRSFLNRYSIWEVFPPGQHYSQHMLLNHTRYISGMHTSLTGVRCLLMIFPLGLVSPINMCMSH